MKWLKRILIFLGVAVLVLATVPFFISLEDYIPRIEQEISARIKEPVKIGSLKASGLPLPHVTVSGISVGKTEDIKVGKVTVSPDLVSLLGATKVIRSIEIDDLMLTQKAVDKIPVWTQADGGKPGAPPAVRVESIKLDNAVLKLQQATFGPLDARLALSEAGSLVSASIVTRDGKLKAVIKPEKTGSVIDFHAREWTPILGPAIHFDDLVVRGVATMNDANLGEVRAKLYGGSVAGKLTVGWGKGIQLKGDADVRQVEIKPLLQALGRPATLSGKLTAKPVFSANAAKAVQLANVLRLDTPFDVQNGILHGVDIGKAATSLLSKDGGKGETRFDKLSGHLAMDRGTRRITRLNVVSGSLAADGNVTISPKDDLSGRINAKVQGSLASASVPLNVSGTVNNPSVFPTGAAVAGAAAGTALLGPGVGTSVGAKVGQWTEGLFGRKEKK